MIALDFLLTKSLETANLGGDMYDFSGDTYYKSELLE